MRVLAVTHSLGANGAALCLYRALLAVKAAGGSTDVVYTGAEFYAQPLQDNGIRIINEAQTANYDVALVNTLIDYGRVMQLAPLLPVVFWVHEGACIRDLELSAAGGWQKAFQLASRLVFDTPDQHQSVFKSLLEGIEPHRILHVSPGVALPPATAAAVAPGGKRIVSVGSVYPRKRPADVVAAVQRLGMDQAHCTLVGDLRWLERNGPDMLATIERHPTSFTLTGEVSDQDKLRHMQNANLFCSASGDETFGMAALEAASLGLPLALSDLPCYQGIWRHGHNALLSPVGAVDCLTWNLAALIQDQELAKRIGQAAQRTAARYTLDRFERGISDVLLQAIEDPLGPVAA